MGDIPLEEQESFVQRVWKNALPDIEKAIGYQISHDLSFRAHGETRKLMEAYLRPMIQKAVEARKVEIENAIENYGRRIIELAKERFENAMHYELKDSLANAVSGPITDLGNRLSRTMFDLVDKIIDEERAERERKKAEAIIASKAQKGTPNTGSST
jgi:hypothetical protein